jgi:uncharacterized glyoxalase superfamily protein PhnB
MRPCFDCTGNKGGPDGKKVVGKKNTHQAWYVILSGPRSFGRSPGLASGRGALSVTLRKLVETLTAMNKTAISSIAPLFIVRDGPAAMKFYRDSLGFEITFQGPTEDDIFFGIVQRGGAMIMMKAIGLDSIPNYTRDIKQGIAPWDAYCHVPDPDALAAEFAGRGVQFWTPLGDNSDDLRGFEVQDADGYVLYFGRPNEK